MASCFLLSGCIGGEEAPSLIDISVEMEGAPGVIHFVKDANNGSSVEQMMHGFYNHISSSWGQKNAYDTNFQSVNTSPNCNPSEGYIHFLWGTESNGKKYFRICGNLGDSQGSNKIYEKKVYHWQ